MRGKTISDTWTGRCAIAASGLLLLAACGEKSDEGESSGSAAASVTAQPARLTFDLVRPIAEQKMGKDPGCGFGEWADNSTGIDEPYRAQATVIKQFDCAESKGALPNAGQQAVYIEFGSPAQAEAYARAKSGERWQAVGFLVAGNTVVEVHQGRLTLDRIRFLHDVRAACQGCGTVITTPLATGSTPGFTG